MTPTFRSSPAPRRPLGVWVPPTVNGAHSSQFGHSTFVSDAPLPGCAALFNVTHLRGFPEMRPPFPFQMSLFGHLQAISLKRFSLPCPLSLVLLPAGRLARFPKASPWCSWRFAFSQIRFSEPSSQRLLSSSHLSTRRILPESLS